MTHYVNVLTGTYCPYSTLGMPKVHVMMILKVLKTVEQNQWSLLGRSYSPIQMKFNFATYDLQEFDHHRLF